MMLRTTCLLSCLAVNTAAQDAPAPRPLEPMDVFEMEWASDPRPQPHGQGIVYVRSGMDVMTDRRRGDLWYVSMDGADHRPLTTSGSAGSPRWSPSGDRLAYVDATEQGAQIFVRWTDSGLAAPITRMGEGPGSLTWSPDGRWLAFTMAVAEPVEPLAQMPPAPAGATWAPAPRVITATLYRADGGGYLEPSHRQLFVLPADGGTPRQLTSGPWDHGGPLVWTPDGTRILCSANRREDVESEPRDSELWAVSVADGALEALTSRYGPDGQPALSPDGEWLAWVGNDEDHMGFQVSQLYIKRMAGGEPRCLTGALDRSVGAPTWTPDGRGIVVQYDDKGHTKLARVGLDGSMDTLAEDVGGTSLGRPYSSGSYTLAGGRLAFTHGTNQRPAEVAVIEGGEPRVLTDLNGDLFAGRLLAPVEERWVDSSADGRAIQYWVARPPGFSEDQRYPMVLEIHGGPFANYGDRFSLEVQLFAAAGYVVVYANPRGSTSYGAEFGNLIHHNYPSQDYDDLMSVVDAMVAEPWIDSERLCVTGGGGGGVLTAWIVGKTERFAAAVVAKPVINWISFVLTADAYPFFWRWWFPGKPWDHFEHYWRRSPLSLVGNVTTPTMLLTGEADYRTPISESEQYYQALKLVGVETAFVRIPEASHGIARRPSQLMAKVVHVLAWFERHASAQEDED